MSGISHEGNETLCIWYRIAGSFVVVAVFNFSFSKGGFVNLTCCMAILQSFAGCSAARGMCLQVFGLNRDGPVVTVSTVSDINLAR